MKTCLKRQTTYTQAAPTVAHLWSADLRERRRLRADVEAMKKSVDEEYAKSLRYKEYLELCDSIIHCRTSKGKVGVEYPILRRRIREWVTNGPTTTGQWNGIKVCLMRHNREHLQYFPHSAAEPAYVHI